MKDCASRLWIAWPIGLALALLLDAKLEAWVPDSSIRQIILFSACNMLVAMSLNVVNGMAGQFSIGHAGFLAVGAYTAAVVSFQLHERWGGGEPDFIRSLLIVPVALVSAAIAGALFGLVVGLPSLRLRGDYLAIVTLGFAEIVRLVIASADASPAMDDIADASFVTHALDTLGSWIGALGGQNGYAGRDYVGVPLYAGPFWVIGLTLTLGIGYVRLKFSGWGRALRALREDEIAASACGVDPTRYKVTSFVISSAGAAIAGGLMATMRDGTPIVSPDTFMFQTSFDAITMVILGGSGSVTGAMIGGLFVTLTVKAIELVQGIEAVQELTTQLPWLDLNAVRMMVYAAVLIMLMVWRPEGLLGEREIWELGWFRRLRGAPEPVGA